VGYEAVTRRPGARHAINYVPANAGTQHLTINPGPDTGSQAGPRCVLPVRDHRTHRRRWVGVRSVDRPAASRRGHQASPIVLLLALTHPELPPIARSCR
jgi:hypothetical protein